MAVRKVKSAFIQPMLLQRREHLPQGADWMYELKLDGYRALAIKTEGKVRLRSRNDNDFSHRYPSIQRLLPDYLTKPSWAAKSWRWISRASPRSMRCRTMTRPSWRSSFTFSTCSFWRDAMSCRNHSPFVAPCLRNVPKLHEPIRYSADLGAALPVLISSVKAQGLEGIVAKRRGGAYQPGLRTGSWLKMRVNQGQEFVIGGYTLSDKNFDALIIGYYEKGKLLRWPYPQRIHSRPADIAAVCL
jgi:bifunctional non-homologous end joining protein LigD